MTRKVEVIPHDPNWYNVFATESSKIAIALGENVVTIYHIGSISISTIHAKPIIDILVEVRSIGKVDASNFAMEQLGYACMGEFGILDRRFFYKDTAAGIRTHHIHTFEAGSAQIIRHISFRDYLNVQENIAI
jgi:GrpB-like predicted nucleotidyltransferase (UPF0157 family)